MRGWVIEMGEVRSPTIRKIIRIVNQIADYKINQGVLLKELAHSIQAHQRDKTPTEWKESVYSKLNKMLEMEQEILK